MKTIKFVLLLIFPLLAITCKGGTSTATETNTKQVLDVGSNTQQPEEVKVKMLNGYFFKNSHEISEDPTFLIFRDQASFDNYLGMARTMDNKIDKPDFETQTNMAIVCMPTQTKTEISIIKAEKTNEKSLNIYFELKTGGSLSYSMQPVCILSFAKDKDVNTVNFVTNGKAVKTMVLNRRSEGAPKSIEDLKKNFTGTFSGVLPCADCSGIETKLTLKEDYTYILESTYKGKGNEKPIISKGKWTPSEDLALIELDYDKQISTFYAFVDKNTFEKLDNQAQRIDSKLNYKLLRSK